MRLVQNTAFFFQRNSMKKQKGEIEWLLIVAGFCFAFVVFAIVATANKQAKDRVRFMDGCLQDNKQYECDVLWSQTDESKQNRDLAIGFAAGAAIGAATARK